MKAAIKFLLTQPEANSRLVYLAHGLAVAIAIVILACVFPFAHDKSGYPAMAGALGGGGLAAAFGRYATKVGDGKQPQ